MSLVHPCIYYLLNNWRMNRLTSLFKSVLRTPRFGFCTLPPSTVSASNAPVEIVKREKYSEKISMHRTTYKLYDMEMQIFGEELFVAPNATVVGEVTMGSDVTIWHGAVLRGDLNAIILDQNISIGENCVLHTASSLPNGLPAQVLISSNSFIQPGCTLYSCELGMNVFVGYNTVIMEGAVVGDGAILDPNSVVPPGRVIPSGQHWGGNPIKYIRDVEDRDKFISRLLGQNSSEKAQLYRQQFLVFNNAYLLKQNDLPEDDVVFRDHRNTYQNFGSNRYDPKKTY